MRDQPTIPLSRLLALRQFPFLAHAELDELAVFADNVHEARFAAGAVVSAADTPPLHLVLEGQIAHPGAHAGSTRTCGPRDVFGMLEVLSGRSLRGPATALTETRTLVLPASDCIELLEDNFGVLRALLRGLAASVVVHRLPRPVPASLPAIAGTPLTLVERLIVLRRQLGLPGARLQPLAALAQACEELRWAPGDRVAESGDDARGAFVVLEGTLRPTCCTNAPILSPGDAFGGLETLADLRLPHTYEAVVPVRVLWAGHAALHDVLEDHTDLALALVSQLATALLEAHASVADAALVASTSATWAAAHTHELGLS